MKKNRENFRIFIYKTIFIFFCTYLLYNFTIGKKIDEYENKILSLKTNQGRNLIKNKIREEMSKSIEKDKILKKEDAVLLKRFLIKIQKELAN